jgi:CspA family cold shock protein
MNRPTLTQRANGTVRSFDLSKGYGYIAIEGREDILVHYMNIEGEGLRMLSQGDQVSFLIEDNPAGPRAVRVTRSE